MPTAAELEALAQAWDAQRLREVWERIKSRDEIPGWPEGKAFEYLVIRAFHLEGVLVRWPFEVTYHQRFGVVEQIDGIIHVDGLSFMVESKCRVDPLGIESIAKLRFRLESRPPGMIGLLFSTSRYSTAAEVFAQFASPLNVLLWSGDDLDVALSKACMVDALREKLRYAQEYGIPLFPLGGVS